MASDSDGSVAKIEFFNGTTKVGEDTTAPYSFDWKGVGPGTYPVTARATDNRGATTTSGVSTITVKGVNQPPKVSITSPANNASFPAGPTITISATGTDPDGTVANVEFRDGSTMLGTPDTTAPYSVTWSNVPSGGHKLTARATDNGGAITTSAAVSITVKR